MISCGVFFFIFFYGRHNIDVNPYLRVTGCLSVCRRIYLTTKPILLSFTVKLIGPGKVYKCFGKVLKKFYQAERLIINTQYSTRKAFNG